MKNAAEAAQPTSPQSPDRRVHLQCATCTAHAEARLLQFEDADTHQVSTTWTTAPPGWAILLRQPTAPGPAFITAHCPECFEDFVRDIADASMPEADETTHTAEGK